jgi:hypothetical protein
MVGLGGHDKSQVEGSSSKDGDAEDKQGVPLCPTPAHLHPLSGIAFFVRAGTPTHKQKLD